MMNILFYGFLILGFAMLFYYPTWYKDQKADFADKGINFDIFTKLGGLTPAVIMFLIAAALFKFSS